MDKEARSKIIATIGSVVLLCILIFMYIWSVVFVRYGDHAKYSIDIVVSIQLGVAMGCFFLILGFIFYIGMVSYGEYISDQKVKEFEAELERQRKKG